MGEAPHLAPHAPAAPARPRPLLAAHGVLLGTCSVRERAWHAYSKACARTRARACAGLNARSGPGFRELGDAIPHRAAHRTEPPHAHLSPASCAHGRRVLTLARRHALAVHRTGHDSRRAASMPVRARARARARADSQASCALAPGQAPARARATRADLAKLLASFAMMKTGPSIWLSARLSSSSCCSADLAPAASATRRRPPRVAPVWRSRHHAPGDAGRTGPWPTAKPCAHTGAAPAHGAVESAAAASSESARDSGSVGDAARRCAAGPGPAWSRGGGGSAAAFGALRAPVGGALRLMPSMLFAIFRCTKLLAHETQKRHAEAENRAQRNSS